LWNLFNLIMAGLALGVVSERRERRTTHRAPTQARGMLQIDSIDLPAQIVDVSQGGMLIRVQGTSPLRMHSQARLTVVSPAETEMSAVLPVKLTSMRFERDRQLIGLSFGELQPSHYSVISTLMFGDLKLLRSTRTARQRTRSIVVGTTQIMAWGLGHTVRGISFALFRRTVRNEPPVASGT
jgi:cellulose synthase (UDP-forming)